MDVELQILRHLARDAYPTVALVDGYCAEYKDLFKEVRNYDFNFLYSLFSGSPLAHLLLKEL